MKTTSYFRDSVLTRRPYLKTDWIQAVLDNPVRSEVQPNGRIRHWAYVEDLDKYLRVVVESDGETVHNAFPDRGFRP